MFAGQLTNFVLTKVFPSKTFVPRRRPAFDQPAAYHEPSSSSASVQVTPPSAERRRAVRVPGPSSYWLHGFWTQAVT